MCPLNDTESVHNRPRLRKYPLRAAFLGAFRSASPGKSTTSRRLLAPGQQHHQAVDPEADPAGRRHALLERLDESLVVGLGLLVAARQLLRLLLEAAALLVGVVELGEARWRSRSRRRRPPSARPGPPRSGATWRTARARPGSRGRRWAGSAPARRASRAGRRPACPSPRPGSRLGARSPRPAPRGSGARRCRCRLRSRIASRSVTRRQGGAKSISRPVALDLGRAQDPLGDLGDQLLDRCARCRRSRRRPRTTRAS